MILSHAKAELDREPLTSLFYLCTFRYKTGNIADNINNRRKEQVKLWSKSIPCEPD